MPDDTLYKKKSLRFSGCGLSKAVRVKEINESRKSSRSEVLNIRRNFYICDDSLISSPKPQKNNAVTVKGIPKKLSRLEQLKKWKEEKALKKKLEEQNRKKAFVVGKAKPETGCFKINMPTLFGSRNASRIISKNSSVISAPKASSSIMQKNTSVTSAAKATNSVIPKLNLPGASGIKPVAKYGAVPSSVTIHKNKPQSFLPASSTSQKTKSQSFLPASSTSQKTKSQCAVAASSVNQRDQSQMKTGIPKSFVSRIPSSRNLPQKVPLGIISVKQNLPASVGNTGAKESAFKNTKKTSDLQCPKPLPGVLPKTKVGKNETNLVHESCKAAVGKSTGKKPNPKEQSKDKEKRQSFAPVNFKFVPSLPKLDLRAFEGLDFTVKRNISNARTSTPIKQTPVPSPENSEIVSTPQHLLSNISEYEDEKENKSANIITEVETSEKTDTAIVPDIIVIEKKAEAINAAENFLAEGGELKQREAEQDKHNNFGESDLDKCNTADVNQDEVKIHESEQDNLNDAEEVKSGESEQDKLNNAEEVISGEAEQDNKCNAADSNQNEIGVNVTRRNRKQRGSSKLVDCDVTEFESISDVKPPEFVCNQRLFSIAEEFENSRSESFATPKSVRRSLRIAKLTNKEEASSFNDSPYCAKKTPVKIEKPSSVATPSDLSEAFNQLQMNSMTTEEELGAQLPAKEMKPKKVSLLYTPPNSRYSLRKSVRGDLISFS